MRLESSMEDLSLSGPALARRRADAASRRRSRAATPWVILIFVLGGGGFAVWDLNQRLQRSRAFGVIAHDELATLRGQAAQLDAELTSARTALARDKEERAVETGKLRGELGAATQKADVATKEAEKADAMADQLEKTIARTEGELVRSRGRLTLNLVDKVLFASGKADLTPRGAKVLARVGAVLKQFPDKQIWVIGHTDDIPIGARSEFTSNWELSSARAVGVVHFLQDEVKVDPKRLAAAGFGPHRPASKGNRAKNRRIEIVLVPRDVEVVK
jgi:chemotaxis protein MotB